MALMRTGLDIPRGRGGKANAITMRALNFRVQRRTNAMTRNCMHLFRRCSVQNSIVLAIATTFLTAITAILGHFLIKARENETRRLQLMRDHTALQIAEFYAPLSALTEQLDAAATIGDTLVVPEDERTKVNDLIFAHSFSATHREIFEILKTKLHLAEGRQIPPSFVKYLRHYWAQNIQSILKQANTSATVNDPGFPEDFFWDVKAGLSNVSARYEDSVQMLQTPWHPVHGLIARLNPTDRSHRQAPT